MEFNPAVHTKEFLLDNPKVAFELAKNSVEFSTCALASDLELIGLVDTWGQTVAHMFAQYQPEWLKSEASKSPDILRLANIVGHTVAHYLAQYQPEWLFSDASKSPEVLRLACDNGLTVAHYLAQFQPEWLLSDASKSPDILRLACNDGLTVAHRLARYQPEWLLSEASNSPEILRLACSVGLTVAHYLAQYQPDWLLSEASQSSDILQLASVFKVNVANVLVCYQSESINHQPLMQKQILTLEDFDGCLLAEDFTEKFGDTHGLDTSIMAMKLIEQGAAYKHSKPMALKVGDTLLNQCKALIEDNIDAKISFKQLMATYSTFHHNVSKIISTDQHETLEQWQDILHKSENMIRQHLNAHPELYDIEHTVDNFCEPADIFLKKLQSERHLSAIQYSINTADIEPIKQAIY
jgi:hypothetical protein